MKLIDFGQRMPFQEVMISIFGRERVKLRVQLLRNAQETGLGLNLLPGLTPIQPNKVDYTCKHIILN